MKARRPALPPGFMPVARQPGSRRHRRAGIRSPALSLAAGRDACACRYRMAGSDDVFHADLHIHSRFSRACSKDCEIPNLAWWAARKGVTVVGTGDFTHPAWAAQLAESLVPAEPGLFRLRPE